MRLRSILSSLSDGYIVRRPLPFVECPVDLFIEHREKGWLAIIVSPATFAELRGGLLFGSPQRTLFESRIERLRNLTRSVPGLASLVVMWACSTDEVKHLTSHYEGLRLVSREQLATGVGQLVDEIGSGLPLESEQSLLGNWFPEAEIPAPCTTRRFLSRSDDATLPRFFLDPQQEWATKLDLEPSDEGRGLASDFSVRLINGVAGSGKTLIAVHRALLLAKLFPQQKILVLIHNTPIVADLNDRLSRAYDGRPGNLEILTFFGWARGQWRLLFGSSPRMPDDTQTVLELVRLHLTRYPALTLSDEQLLEELDFINDRLIRDQDAYRTANRAGRGFALRESERNDVWALYEKVSRALNTGGLRLWSALPREICLAADRHGSLQRYDHILVDEAQFFAPSWFQLVQFALSGHGQLFLCADPNQGFMKNRLSWKSVGLNVAGRTRKLRHSYRTTKAILETASAMLTILLGSRDDEDYLEPIYDGMEQGVKPMLLYAESPQDALDRLVRELAALVDQKGMPLSAFLVIYGENVNRGALHAQLCNRFGHDRVWWLNDRFQKKEPPGDRSGEHLRMAYVDTATGLEAGLVFLIGMEPQFLLEPLRADASETQRERLEANARKLYMAMTRAGQRLFVVSSQRIPGTMETLFDVP